MLEYPHFIYEWMLDKITQRGLDARHILTHVGCTHSEIENIMSKKDYRIGKHAALTLSYVFEIPIHCFYGMS